jgi:hypothetical protein
MVTVVTALPAPVLKKVVSFVRLMGSNHEGEREGSVHGLARMLKAAGYDFHVVADLLEQSNGGGLSESEMKKLYDAGYADGVAAAEAKMSHDEDGFRNVNGSPSWHTIAVFCQDRSKRLRPLRGGFR